MVTLDLGFDPTHVVTGHLELPDPRYREPARRVVFIRSALDHLYTLQGVSAAALATGTPMYGGVGMRVRIPGRSAGPFAPWVFGVTPAYFRALGMRIVRGSDFGNADSATMVINEAAARTFFPGENPLDKQVALLLGRAGEWMGTIVGVVADTRMSFNDPPSPVVYYPLESRPLSTAFVVARAGGSPGDLQRPLRETIQYVDPTLALDDVSTMTDRLSFLWARQRFYGLVLAVCAAFGLALAAAGTFGLVSYAVVRRTRELGLRMALGADRRNVIALVVAKGMRVAIVGVLMGVVLALATTRALRSLLYEVRPTDPLVLAVVSGLLMGVCLLASYVPARRAASVDPMVALRAE
jgi:putative ABC transport system permease protein